MNKKEDWENFSSSHYSITPLNKAWNRVRQQEGNGPKKVTIFEVNGAQYKDSKVIANKIGDTLAELRLHLFRTET